LSFDKPPCNRDHRCKGFAYEIWGGPSSFVVPPSGGMRRRPPEGGTTNKDTMLQYHHTGWLFLSCLFLAFLAAPAALPAPQPPGPLLPRDEQMTFRVPKGFRVELVASEPDVIDPVAMAFDEDGRLFVAEMPGYPNKGVGTGLITSGRVRLLEDRDGDGFYETS